MWSSRSADGGMPYGRPVPVEYRAIVDGCGRVVVDASMLSGIADIVVGSPELAHIVAAGGRVVVDSVRPVVASEALVIAAGQEDCPLPLRLVFKQAASALELAADRVRVADGLAKLFGGR